MTQTVSNSSATTSYISNVSALIGAGQSGDEGGVDSTALLDELVVLTKRVDLDKGTGSSADAPELDLPTLGFTTDDMAILLTALRSKTFEEQIKTGKDGLEIDRKKTEDINDRAMKKIQEWIDKSKDALEKDKAGGIFGWLTKIFSFIAAAICTALAAVATAVTGGAAAPLLAISVILLAGTTLSLASAISQECGGPALEPSAWLSDLMTKMLVSFGMDEEKAKSLGKILATVAATVVTGGAALAVDPQLMGNLAGGIAELSGASKDTAMWLNMAFTIAMSLALMVVATVMTGGAAVTQAVDKLSKFAAMAMKVGRAMQAGSGIAAGTTQVGHGAMQIQAAEAQHLADKAMANKKELEALLLKLQKLMEEGREDLKKIMQAVEEMMSNCIRMLTTNSETHLQLIDNIGSTGSTV
ncbi:type III secretion system translocon subunit SctE [Noviherbaspirillum sp.]|jgi:hypothetical protein|uniref:type III secretion system translocon subunit SctE n=1 Tax=Noviherbaspirillum sp. TaxID=1926288 RepID=UPI0025DFF124|nr:type III secretion system translocon subunit SctE [Noviherbaspirillum sp.]